MSFEIPFNTLCLSHNVTQLQLAVSTTLQFRFPLGVEIPMKSPPSLTNLHLFWLQPNGDITLSLRFGATDQSSTGLPLEHAARVLCNSSVSSSRALSLL
jgi:hypothetical protein